MLLFSLLDDEDGGFAPRYSIFSPYSKERFNDRCLRRGLTAVDTSRQCSGQIHTKVFSNSEQVAESIGKKLFDTNRVKQVYPSSSSHFDSGTSSVIHIFKDVEGNPSGHTTMQAVAANFSICLVDSNFVLYFSL